MKAYRIVLLVIDHDKLGADGIETEIVNVRYPNHCISPSVMEIVEADIGEWTDAHPLNQYATMGTEMERLFPSDSATYKYPDADDERFGTIPAAVGNEPLLDPLRVHNPPDDASHDPVASALLATDKVGAWAMGWCSAWLAACAEIEKKKQ